jgi:hypothetical protein
MRIEVVSFTLNPKHENPRFRAWVTFKVDYLEINTARLLEYNNEKFVTMYPMKWGREKPYFYITNKRINDEVQKYIADCFKHFLKTGEIVNKKPQDNFAGKPKTPYNKGKPQVKTNYKKGVPDGKNKTNK